jgi:hypothetical protein
MRTAQRLEGVRRLTHHDSGQGCGDNLGPQLCVVMTGAESFLLGGSTIRVFSCPMTFLVHEMGLRRARISAWLALTEELARLD